MRAFGFVALLALAGCATHAAQPSPVATSGTDAPAIGRVVADYVGAVLPPATSTVWVAADDGPNVAPSAVRGAVVAALRDRGFAVAEGAESGAGAHPLRVVAVPLDLDVLVRVDLDRSIASRLLARDSTGGLSAASPFSVRAVQ